MKRLAVLALGAAIAVPGLAADVGVSIAISQPGVYGRIDIGRYPQPVVVAPQPVLIAPPVAVAAPPPVYLWVPPGHRKHWSKHCREYNACGYPVYFVRDDWYQQHVMEGQPQPYQRDEDRGRGHDHGHGHRD